MIYIDPLRDYGWKLRGHPQRSCHMFSDEEDLTALHEVAYTIGMKRGWFQDERVPHYDLTPSRREKALQSGVVEVSFREAVKIWKILYPRG